MDPQANAEQSAAELHKSLHDKILSLPETLEIYPTHFSGSVCGAGMSGKASSTLAFEKRWNPALALDRAAFIEKMTSGTPPKPSDIDTVLHANRTGRLQ